MDSAPNSLTDPADPDARISAWRLGLLEELAEIGMDVARTVRKQAIAQKQLQDVGDRAGVVEIVGAVITLAVRGDFGLVYGRVARAVRMTLALHARLWGEETDRRAGIVAQAAPVSRAARPAISERVREAEDIDRADEAEESDEDAPEYPRGDIESEAFERLEDEDEYAALDRRPLRESVASVCKELNVTPDWRRWDGVDDTGGDEGREAAMTAPSEPPGDRETAARARADAGSDVLETEPPRRPRWRDPDG
jgi:hypothetical protein